MPRPFQLYITCLQIPTTLVAKPKNNLQSFSDYKSCWSKKPHPISLSLSHDVMVYHAKGFNVIPMTTLISLDTCTQVPL